MLNYPRTLLLITFKSRSLFYSFVLLLSSVLSFYGASVSAKVVAVAPEITDYQLQCDEVFACPEIIDGRVNFWVNVFYKWKKENRILHDSRQPERVYMVLDTKDQCSRKKPKGEVKSGIKLVKERLEELKRLIELGADKKRLQKHPYYKLFPNASASYIEEAKGSIRCQSGNREMFEQALKNFQLYRPYIINALQAQKLPLDIQYLPFVESSYNPKAFSFAGAAGMWQIMPATARSLGLQIGSSIDERFEPEFATLAAAKYFRESIDRLSKTAQEGQHSTAPKDINPFVITSYNYGVRGMQRAIIQVGTDYERLLMEYKSGSFQIAVRNFYASFLAARHVAQNQAIFFPNLKLQKQTTAVNRIALPKPLLAKQLLTTLKVPKKELQALNPGITYRVWKNQSAVPTGYILKLPYKSSGWNAETAKLKTLKSASKGDGDSGRTHKVRKGQTACGIANSYKVRCKDVIRLNKLNRKAVVKIGQRLKIPGGVQKYRLTSIVKASKELRLQLASQAVVNKSDNIVQSEAISTAEALRLEQTPAIIQPTPEFEQEKNTRPTSVASVVKNNEGAAVIQQQVSTVANVDKSVDQNKANSTANASQLSEAKPADRKNSAEPNSELSKLINLDTNIYERNGRYWVNVLPSESLGLYADWLGIGSSRELRRMNKLGGKSNIDVYQRIYLPSIVKQKKQDFKLSRNEYHLELQLQYFQRFKVSKVVRRTVKANETMWSISKNNRIPMWLLMQYNKQVKRGQSIEIPIIKAK